MQCMASWDTGIPAASSHLENQPEDKQWEDKQREENQREFCGGEWCSVSAEPNWLYFGNSL